MVKEITSKEEMIEKLKWVRKKINEWEKRFQEEKTDYIVLPKGERGEVFGTFRAVERFFHLK